MSKIIITVLIISSTVIAQQVNPAADSIKLRYNFPVSIHNLNQLSLPDNFFTDFSEYPELQILALEYSGKENTEPDIRTIRTNLLKDFRQSMQWKADYNLGVFGEVLGYAMTAATFGLAVQHVVKYKNKKLFKND